MERTLLLLLLLEGWSFVGNGGHQDKSYLLIIFLLKFNLIPKLLGVY